MKTRRNIKMKSIKEETDEMVGPSDTSILVDIMTSLMSGKSLPRQFQDARESSST